MRDYHVFSLDAIGDKPVDHGVVLDIKDVPWAGRQMWAPDAAEQNGRYYFYFPAKDKQDVFRIGVAVGNNPAGPFTREPEPIKGTLQHRSGCLQGQRRPALHVLRRHLGRSTPALGHWHIQPEGRVSGQRSSRPSAARSPVWRDDMISLAEAPQDVVVQDESGKPLTSGDNARRFFEASWMHKYRDTYYFSYSTGDTHFIVYATSKSPYGPFTYKGKILEPVLGWTNHHSIVEFKGKWYLFYHDAQALGRPNPPAQRQGNRAEVSRRRLDRDDRRVLRAEAVGWKVNQPRVLKALAIQKICHTRLKITKHSTL